MTAPTLEDLLHAHPELRERLEEAEAVLRAIQDGEVDAVFVNAGNNAVYTLESADKPYRVMVEQMPNGAATLTPDGLIIYCNRRFAELLKRPHQDLLGKPIQQFISPDSHGQFETLLKEARASEVRAEVMLRTGPDSQTPVYLGAAPLQEGAYGLCLIISDLTEQRHYVALQQAQRTLAAVTERLELAQQAGQIGTFERNLITGETQWSVSQEELYGLPPGGFGGRYEDWLRRLHPLDREGTDQVIQRAVEQKSVVETEFRVVHPSGEVRWIACKGKVLCDGSGKAVRLIGINQDITERRRAVDELKEGVRRKDEFLATLAHELRNPLAPIATALELMDVTGPMSKTQQESLQIIRRQTAQLSRLLDDLLDVSRITRGFVQLKSRVLDLTEVLAEAVKATQRLLKAKRHRLTTVMMKEPVLVYGDETRLIQVFTNLLNNAARYTPDGGSIELHVECSGEEALVRVKDNGIGIDPALLDKVFDLFQQGDQPLARSEGGLGIGLTLVRRIVELHGGSVRAQSAGSGQGCEMAVRLPLSRQRPAKASAAAPVHPVPISPIRILVVDDNVDAASSLSTLLKLTGHEVKTEHTGPNALATIRAWNPQAVLLDIGLPGMNGYDVARELRESGYRGFIVALTGYGQESDRARSASAGFDVHLVKPVDFEKLRLALSQRFAAGGGDASHA